MIVGVIPARGGSKRAPRKNIHPLGGKPLLAWTVEAGLAAGLSPCVVSTEDDEIAAAAAAAGARVVRRPPHLAADDSSTESAVLDALDQLGDEVAAARWVAILQPTSPFRSAETIRRAVAMAQADPTAGCVMTVTETRADFWRASAPGNGPENGPENGIVRLFPDAPRRQQAREPLYDENSAVYVVRIDMLRATGSVLGGTMRGLPISPMEGFDINTSFDLKLAAALAQAGEAEA
jgi:CMP-N-acetylneuraminic acid synthetase